MNFQEHYAGLSDDELLMVAASRAELLPEASTALDSEMSRRQLTHEQAHAKKKAVNRLVNRDGRRRRLSKGAAKYVVSRINGWAMLTIVLGAPSLVLMLLIFHLVPERWLFPILSAFLGSSLAVAWVQPWLRKTSSFWIALSISCAVELLAGLWIRMHLAPEQGSESKGVAFLTILMGYAVGTLSFFLLQKLQPNKGTQ